MTYPFSLGRIAEPKDQRDWHISRLLGVDLIQKPIDKIWPTTETLDQGQTSACTGFSQAICALCGPIVEGGITNETAQEIYALAQTMDGIPGPHEGSTITAAAKAVMQKFPGMYDGYYFCTTMNEVLSAISYVGPVVFGTDWLESMFSTDSNDYVVVDEGSPVAGGHAYCIASNNMEAKRNQLDQSWGPSFGRGGKAFFHTKDLSFLLARPNSQAIVMKNKHKISIS